MISISGKIWKQEKINKNLVEKVKQDYGFGDIISRLIISRNYDVSEIYGINNYQKLTNIFQNNHDFIESVKITEDAINNKDNICIIGDYDVNSSHKDNDVYSKGANILNTVRQILNNDDQWRQTLKGIGAEFYHQTVTTEQIETFIAKQTGMELRLFFDQYLRTSQIPIFEYHKEKGKLMYRWDETLEGFNMPIDLKIDDKEKFESLFFSKKDNLVNPYIDDYRSFELEYSSLDNNFIEILFSKYGLLSINNSALKQSIEIVRRRIDDVGTKEPTILQRGEKRILVELPGLKDPERIKNLLGKTAQLNFRLVADNDEFGIDKLVSEIGEELNISKRIIMSNIKNGSNNKLVAGIDIGSENIFCSIGCLIPETSKIKLLGLGTSSVKGFNLVPKPPASIAILLFLTIVMIYD